jgi:acyl-CoA synthetase (AMP-forming)/AMP-acid ligase II
MIDGSHTDTAPLAPNGLVPDGWISVADQLRANSEARPDHPALICVDDGRSVTWVQLAGYADCIAAFLRSRALGANDRVAVLGGNSLEWLLLYYGVQRYGATFCTINVEVNAHHAREMLRRMAPRIVLHDAGLDVSAVQDGAPGDWFPYARSEADEGFFAGIRGLDPDPAPPPVGGPEDCCVVSFTSGTESAPKGVLHDYSNYFAIAEHQRECWSLTEADRILDVRAYSWASAHMLSLNPVLRVGGTLLFARDFSRSRFFSWLRAYRPTVIVAVPTVVNMLLERREEAEADGAFDGVRFLSCSTAPLSPDRHLLFEQTYGIPLVQLYGMSEGGVVCANRPETRRVGSVGRPGKYQQLTVRGADGAALPPGKAGDIETVSAQHAHAYLHADGTIEPIRGRPLRTGDIGLVEEDGFVRITGRAKDVIIRGGVNIAPLEIDNALMAGPGVAEAAVIGVPDAVWGEAVCAFVAFKPGTDGGEAALRAHCEAVLPATKCPQHYVVLDALPKNDRAKLDRNALRALWDARG